MFSLVGRGQAETGPGLLVREPGPSTCRPVWTGRGMRDNWTWNPHVARAARDVGGVKNAHRVTLNLQPHDRQRSNGNLSSTWPRCAPSMVSPALIPPVHRLSELHMRTGIRCLRHCRLRCSSDSISPPESRGFASAIFGSVAVVGRLEAAGCEDRGRSSAWLRLAFSPSSPLRAVLSDRVVSPPYTGVRVLGLNLRLRLVRSLSGSGSLVVEYV